MTTRGVRSLLLLSDNTALTRRVPAGSFSAASLDGRRRGRCSLHDIRGWPATASATVTYQRAPTATSTRQGTVLSGPRRVRDEHTRPSVATPPPSHVCGSIAEGLGAFGPARANMPTPLPATVRFPGKNRHKDGGVTATRATSTCGHVRGLCALVTLRDQGRTPSPCWPSRQRGICSRGEFKGAQNSLCVPKCDRAQPASRSLGERGHPDSPWRESSVRVVESDAGQRRCRTMRSRAR